LPIAEYREISAFARKRTGTRASRAAVDIANIVGVI
jgi:hypothetical protein